jgi:prevent-host-death family protein
MEAFMRATAKDLRSKAHKILEAVSRGEEVVITYRGKARARIVRYKKAKEARAEKHALFGMWADNLQTADVDRYVRDLRKGRYGC